MTTYSQWRVAIAPGRVNLIGEHTDYQGGWSLPVAIDLDARIRFRPNGSGRVQLRSEHFGTQAELPVASAARHTDHAHLADWARGAACVLEAVHTRGHSVGAIDAEVTSTVPLGSGLSSSAAFNVALALAVTAAAGQPLEGNELALTAQQAEHLNGVPCGIMDQMASVHGRAGHAVLLDARSLAWEPVAIPADMSIIVVHCGVPRRLADSQYAQRRAACEAAAKRIGVSELRDADYASVADDPFARHVVSENERVHAFVGALRTGDLARLGEILDASHASLRDDFAVSTPELDALCGALRSAGASGARLTGAGFGGCVVAIAPAATASEVTAQACARYRVETGAEPLPFVTHACDGARIEPLQQ